MSLLAPNSIVTHEYMHAPTYFFRVELSRLLARRERKSPMACLDLNQQPCN